MTDTRDILTKINLIKLDRLEKERLKYYNEKVKYIKNQDYSLAAEMRDKERHYLLMIDRLKKILKLNNNLNK